MHCQVWFLFLEKHAGHKLTRASVLPFINAIRGSYRFVEPLPIHYVWCIVMQRSRSRTHNKLYFMDSVSIKPRFHKKLIVAIPTSVVYYRSYIVNNLISKKDFPDKWDTCNTCIDSSRLMRRDNIIVSHSGQYYERDCIQFFIFSVLFTNFSLKLSIWMTMIVERRMPGANFCRNKIEE